MPGNKCVFNDAWNNNTSYWWLRLDLTNKHEARCTVCVRSFVISNMGEPAIESHMVIVGKKHLRFVGRVIKLLKFLKTITFNMNERR